MVQIGNGGNYILSQFKTNSSSDIPRFNSTNMTGKITIDPQKISERLKDILPKTVKEETVTNADGTTTTITTNSWGMTLHVTKRKDENGVEYEERIQKNKDGSLQAKIIKKNNTKVSEFYDKKGKLEFEQTITYQQDGITVKTEDWVSYNTQKDGKVVSHEKHKYENGDEVEIHYDMEPDNKSCATVRTKENGKSVVKNYDLTDSDMIRGDAKLDKDGNIITVGGKEPRITSKVMNEGLPIETRHYYSYNDDGTIEERIVDANGNEKINMYDNEEDLKQGITLIDKIAQKIEDGKVKLPKTAAPNETKPADKTSPTQNGTSKPKAKTNSGNAPKAGEPSRYYKGFIIETVDEKTGQFYERDSKNPNHYNLCNKDGSIRHSEWRKPGDSNAITKRTLYKNGKPTYTATQSGKDVIVRDHIRGETKVYKNYKLEKDYKE